MSIEKEGSIQINDSDVVAIHDLKELGYDQELVRASVNLIFVVTECLLMPL